MIHFDLKRHNQLLSIEKLNKLNKNKMNKFNIGDEVICIHSNFYIDYVKTGNVYIMSGRRKSIIDENSTVYYLKNINGCYNESQFEFTLKSERKRKLKKLSYDTRFIR